MPAQQEFLFIDNYPNSPPVPHPATTTALAASTAPIPPEDPILDEICATWRIRVQFIVVSVRV